MIFLFHTNSQIARKLDCIGISICWFDISEVVQTKILLFFTSLFPWPQTVQRAPLFFTVQNMSVEEKK